MKIYVVELQDSLMEVFDNKQAAEEFVEYLVNKYKLCNSHPINITETELYSNLNEFESCEDVYHDKQISQFYLTLNEKLNSERTEMKRHYGE
jgi:hypothetical protein